jgi:hypothetical protein
MRPRHAAALALVGWCLLTPPEMSNYGPNTHAPISRWHIEAFPVYKVRGGHPENLVMKGFNETVIVYDTKPNCEAARADFIKYANRVYKKTGDTNNVDTAKSMKCVSTDDRRLDWSGNLRK